MSDFDKREYETVILGGLLHDIGKMLQRGTFGELDTKGQHPKVSADFVRAFRNFFSTFVEYDLLENLVQRHHEDGRSFGPELLCQNAPSTYRNLCVLVSRADNYSSSERRDKATSYQDYKETPLASVWARIRLDPDKPVPKIMRYRLGTLTPERIFPEAFDTYEEGEMNQHLTQFGLGFRAMVSGLESRRFDHLLTHTLALLFQFGWNMPSNTQEEIPDVSLYDHLKTTAAIASCLYQYHSPNMKEAALKDDGEKKFCLLAGDLSGIQNYIFGITHVGAGGAAKRLRARSLYMGLLSDIASHRILHAFRLPLTNVLMASGGKFHILLPNTPDGNRTIESIQREVDEWLFNRYNGEIAMNLASVPFSGSDFKRFNMITEAVGNKLRAIKKAPFHSILTCDSG